MSYDRLGYLASYTETQHKTDFESTEADLHKSDVDVTLTTERTNQRYDASGRLRHYEDLASDSSTPDLQERVLWDGEYNDDGLVAHSFQTTERLGRGLSKPMETVTQDFHVTDHFD